MSFKNNEENVYYSEIKILGLQKSSSVSNQFFPK